VNNFKHQKGFTLIELLVVIAIIGVLASVVLASLNSARAKAGDTSVKSNLSNIRSTAELYYSEMGRYGSFTGTYYAGDCLTNSTMFRETSITGPARDQADRITQAIAQAVVSGGGGKQCRTDDLRTAYLIAIQLKSTNEYWCIDNMGSSKNIGSSLPAAFVLICP